MDLTQFNYKSLHKLKESIDRRVYIPVGDRIAHPKKFKIASSIANNVLRFSGNQRCTVPDALHQPFFGNTE